MCFRPWRPWFLALGGLMTLVWASEVLHPVPSPPKRPPAAPVRFPLSIPDRAALQVQSQASRGRPPCPFPLPIPAPRPPLQDTGEQSASPCQSHHVSHAPAQPSRRFVLLSVPPRRRWSHARRRLREETPLHEKTPNTKAKKKKKNPPPDSNGFEKRGSF